MIAEMAIRNLLAGPEMLFEKLPTALSEVRAVVGAPGAPIAVKLVVRPHRPSDPSVQVPVGTPSGLSFPSAHATWTTTAAVLYGGMLGRPLIPVLVSPVLVSRLVLGVHYPSDVLVGSALGVTIGAGVRGTCAGTWGSAAQERCRGDHHRAKSSRDTGGPGNALTGPVRPCGPCSG
jgi:membrane-associated phospholipid phosphatase